MLARIDRARSCYELQDGQRLTFAQARAYALAAAFVLDAPDLIPPRRLGTRRAFRAYTRARQAIAPEAHLQFFACKWGENGGKAQNLIA